MRLWPATPPEVSHRGRAIGAQRWFPFLSLMASACSSATGPSELASYRLVRVNGDPVPVVIVRAETTDGSVYELEAVQGILTLYQNGNFEKPTDFRNVRNGVPDDTLNHGGSTGTFLLTATTLTISFTDSLLSPEDPPVIYQDQFQYSVLEDGRVLRGTESLGGTIGGVYEYERIDVVAVRPRSARLAGKH